MDALIVFFAIVGVLVFIALVAVITVIWTLKFLAKTGRTILDFPFKMFRK